jgi:transcriptional regulator with XRE-family HTH domain
MNDFSDINDHGDFAILQNIGLFIKTKRIDKNLTQQELAEKAAISRSTLSLVEHGENVALLNLIKILRILDALYVLGDFKIPNQISPMILAKEEEKKRKRATKAKPQPGNRTEEW